MKKNVKANIGKIFLVLLVFILFCSVVLGKDKIMYQVALNKAFHYSEKGEYALEIAEYDKMIKLDPSIYEVYVNKAIAQANLHEYNSSLKTFKKALNLNSEDPELYFNLAHLYAKMGDNKKSEEALQKGTELDFQSEIIKKEEENNIGE